MPSCLRMSASRRLSILITTSPASWARRRTGTRAFESAGAITMEAALAAIISSTMPTWRLRSRSSLMPLTIKSYAAALAAWCFTAPSAIVEKNSLARDFMTRAIFGFLSDELEEDAELEGDGESTSLFDDEL